MIPPIKEIVQTGVIIMIIVWVIISFNQSRQNAELVQRLEKLTIIYSDNILNKVIENQKVIIGNLTEHRQVTNTTIAHLDIELDEVLKLLGGSNKTLPDIDMNDTGMISGFGEPQIIK